MSPNETNTVIEKTRELCQTILQQPSLISARQHMDAFLGDEPARTQYESLVNKSQALQKKQEMSVALSEEEIADFETHRETVLGNPVSRAYLDAQQDLQEIRHSVNKLISMSLETGRVPSVEDFQSASCGHGCHCH
jgi:cell fate (sporulation/competence/biofilm development) regulator YlbF (YheA/YmcA/DUF963 family)